MTKKQKTIALILSALVACAAICLAVIFGFPALRQASTSFSGTTHLDKRANELLSKMSVEEKIGQVLLMDFRYWGVDADGIALSVDECNDNIREIIQKYHLGNIILFGENTRNTERAVRMVEDLQKASLDGGGLPLLVGTDQEGGYVTRLGQGTCLPGNMALGASGKTENARLAGEVIGKELAAIGINCNFAPVCDVNDNPKNPAIHLRSFSAYPEVVSEMAKAMRQGITSQGVGSAAKHFPGHGNTSVDSHFGLPLVDKSKADWEATEAVPFRAIIEDGVDMVMTAHIQYPQLDDTTYKSKMTGETLYLPATLSRKIITDILRGEMGFDGVVVTDAMNMQAITDNFGAEESCVMALAAGADLLCNPASIIDVEDIGKLDRVYDEIKSAINDGRLSLERLNEAAGRVLQLKIKRGIIGGEEDNRTVDEKVESALLTVGSPEHRAIERKLADDAITLYSKTDYAPIKPEADDTILFFVPYANKANSVTYAVNRLINEKKIPAIKTEIVCYEEQSEVSDTMLEQIKAADAVVIVSQMFVSDLDAPENWQVKLPLLLTKAVSDVGKVDQTAVISIGLPNDAVNYPNFPVYIAYGFQGMDKEDAKTGIMTKKYGPNLPAAIDCLMGAFEPNV